MRGWFSPCPHPDYLLFTHSGDNLTMKMEHLTDREISWLSFDQRVLELAEDSTVPLLERLRFLAISSSNLDEFFMVRVATLMSKIENDVTAANVAGYKPKELLEVVNKRVNELVSRQSKVLQEEIPQALMLLNMLKLLKKMVLEKFFLHLWIKTEQKRAMILS